MLNMDLNASIDSIPFLNFMTEQEKKEGSQSIYLCDENFSDDLFEEENSSLPFERDICPLKRF